MPIELSAVQRDEVNARHSRNGRQRLTAEAQRAKSRLSRRFSRTLLVAWRRNAVATSSRAMPQPLSVDTDIRSRRRRRISTVTIGAHRSQWQFSIKLLNDGRRGAPPPHRQRSAPRPAFRAREFSASFCILPLAGKGQYAACLHAPDGTCSWHRLDRRRATLTSRLLQAAARPPGRPARQAATAVSLSSSLAAGSGRASVAADLARSRRRCSTSFARAPTLSGDARQLRRPRCRSCRPPPPRTMRRRNVMSSPRFFTAIL